VGIETFFVLHVATSMTTYSRYTVGNEHERC